MSDSEQLNHGPMFEPPEGFPFTGNDAIRQAEPADFLAYPLIAGIATMNNQIAAAVEMHSKVDQHPVGRLFGTAHAAIQLVYGDQETSGNKARDLWKYHNKVEGQHEGISYGANFVDLQVWVLAAVFKGFEESERRWSKPLSAETKEELYGNFRIFGQVFGLPQQSMPENVSELNNYWQDTLQGDALLTADASRRVAAKVIGADFSSKNRFINFGLSRGCKIFAAISKTSLESISPDLLERSGLSISEDERLIGQRVDKTIRSINKVVRAPVRQQILPAYLATSGLFNKLRRPSLSKNGPG